MRPTDKFDGRDASAAPSGGEQARRESARRERAHGRPVRRPRPHRIAWLILGAGAVVAMLPIWWFAGRRAPRTTPAAGASGGMAAMPGMAGNTGMEGMAGMSVTAGGGVQVTADQIRQFGITFDTALVRPLTAEVRTTGIVIFDETTLQRVTPKFGGFIDRLYVNITGQPVQRGQPLADIYSPELVAAQQELLLAQQLERDMGRSSVPGVPGGSTGLLAAARRRLQLWDISDAQIEAVLQSGNVRRALTLYAPASGVVVEKNVIQGQAVSPGDPLFTIANLSNVWVDVQLREADAALVRRGSEAKITFAGLPGRELQGRVAYVYPTLDSTSRALRARIAVPNPGGVLKPGMYATVRLATPGRSALTVPNSAVLRTGERNLVFVDMGQQGLVPREVELGRTAGNYTEVLSGLEPGARVVTSAQFLLDSESNLGDVMKAMIGQGGGGDATQDMPGMRMTPPSGDTAASDTGMPNMPGMQQPATPGR